MTGVYWIGPYWIVGIGNAISDIGLLSAYRLGYVTVNRVKAHKSIPRAPLKCTARGLYDTCGCSTRTETDVCHAHSTAEENDLNMACGVSDPSGTDCIRYRSTHSAHVVRFSSTKPLWTKDVKSLKAAALKLAASRHREKHTLAMHC